MYCGFTSPLGRVTPGHNGFCSYQTTLLKGFYLRKILIVGKLLNYKVKTWKNSIIRRILVNYLIFIWLVSFLWIKLWPVLFIQLLYLSGPRTLHSYNKKFRIFFYNSSIDLFKFTCEETPTPNPLSEDSSEYADDLGH